MGENRKNNFIFILVFLVIVAVYALSYNQSVSTALANTSSADREMLQSNSDEVIARLRECDSIDGWSDIISSYNEMSIVIEDNSNNIVCSSSDGNAGSVLDVNVRNVFEYNGNAYLMTSSVYLLRNYQIAVVKFVAMQMLLIGTIALILLVLIYAIFLRPYKQFYDVMAEYEQTGNIRKRHFRGYVGNIYNRFYEMTKRLDLQQENQRRIIASISHDIKTPLTSIMGYAERLKKDSISSERREKYINTVYNKSLEIRDLVDEFDEYLGYNMLKDVTRIYVSTGELKKMLKDEYGDELENNGISFDVRCTDMEAAVMIDTSKMKRVFGNIINNSVKHLGDDEKKISVKIETVQKKVLITFSDSGEGVKDENMSLIFEPLYTSDKGRKVAGLGLAICKEIVESHGGKIYAHRSELGGLAVCIELKKEKYRIDNREYTK